MSLRWRVPLPKARVAPATGSGFRRRTRIEWAVLTLLVLTVVVLAVKFEWLQRADLAFYDESIGASGRPASDAIVIVAIDDKSIEALGRWPWRRSVLAAAVDRIAAAGPRAIGLDVIMSEPDNRYPEDDAAFAGSLARARATVVLPAFVDLAGDEVRVRSPLAALQADIGHINVTVDTDGVAREVFLEEGSLDTGSSLRHFSLQIAKAFRPDAAASVRVEPAIVAERGGWQRRGRLRIPYVGPPGRFMQVSVIDVLDGKVSPDLFHGKAILIGATATGLGDYLSTPVSRDGHAMSGVEILANTVQAVLENNAIVRVGDTEFWFATLLPALLFAWISLMLPPRAALAGGLAVVGTLVAVSYLLLAYAHIWIMPSAAILGCVVFFPLWLWLRQEAALRFLADELRSLEQESGLMTPADRGTQSSLDDRMRAVHRMSSHVRDVRRFLADGLESLPEATLICRQDGAILMANRCGVALAPALFGEHHGIGSTATVLHAAHAERPTIQAVLHHVFGGADSGIAYWDALCGASERDTQLTRAAGMELVTRDDRSFLLHGAPLHAEQGEIAGLIVSLVDITQIRIAERQREQTMHFLSHDMRSPQASILALIELQEDARDALQPEDLLRRIGTYANRTLALADDFIQLARAESQRLALVSVDLVEVLFDASDELWPLANARNIEIRVESDMESASVRGEPALLARAIGNLINNAIKYSNGGSSVRVRLSATSTRYRIDVIDQGPGIAEEDQARLFQPFSRIKTSMRNIPDGSGLGLAFVRTVAERHGGQAQVLSFPGNGATFSIDIPRSGSTM
jgi:CHASE2 domain-containing sensor protein/signal transduction histidine kinase